MVYHRQSFASVDELKQAVVKAWEKLSQSFLEWQEHRRMASSLWRRDAAEWRTYWAHVQI